MSRQTWWYVLETASDVHETFVEAHQIPLVAHSNTGAVLSGRPECRFEAYARAWAGCGRHVHRNYKRSYARLYEHIACATHGSDDKFRELYEARPQDLIGRLVRLEALEVDRHAGELHDITCGEAYFENKAFDPKEVWGFLNYGPFKKEEDLKECPIFHRQNNEAAFAIIENVTDRLLGIVMLTKDEPQNLSIQMETPIIKPSSAGGPEPIEACFLLLEKLFALGYRRIQMAVDSQDANNKKQAVRLGFTKEAELPKHMIVKDSNRDSTIYGMLNNDWENGARSFLYDKLHGTKLQKIDAANNKKETEIDEQTRQLAEKKKLAAEEEERAKTDKKKK